MSPEEEAALARIQAAQRGLDARKGEPESEEPGSGSLSQEEQEALRRIQAAQRGAEDRLQQAPAVQKRRKKRWGLRKSRMYRFVYDFQLKKLIASS
ncbi:unnamed protein product [Effrenium voratum]|nr:unnamed protein product [Effrenium voratum]